MSSHESVTNFIIAVMEIRGGVSLIPTVGGAVAGGTVVLIIFLILIALLIAKYNRNRQELSPSVNVTLSKFTTLFCSFAVINETFVPHVMS